LWYAERAATAGIARALGVDENSFDHMKGAERYKAVKARLEAQRQGGHLDMSYLKKVLLSGDDWKIAGAHKFLSEILADHEMPKQDDAYKADPMNFVLGIGLDLHQVKTLASLTEPSSSQARGHDLRQNYERVITEITSTADRHRSLRKKSEDKLMTLLTSKKDADKARSILRSHVEARPDSTAALQESDKQFKFWGFARQHGTRKDKVCLMEHFDYLRDKRKAPPTASYSAKLVNKVCASGQKELLDMLDAFSEARTEGAGMLMKRVREEIRLKGQTRDRTRMIEFLCAFNGKKDLPKRILHEIGKLDSIQMAFLEEVGTLKREGRKTMFNARLNAFLFSSDELSMATMVTATLAVHGVSHTMVERWRAYHGKKGASTTLYASKAALHDDIRCGIGEKGQVRAGLFDSPFVNACVERGTEPPDLVNWLQEHAPAKYQPANIKNAVRQLFDWFEKHADRVKVHLAAEDEARLTIREPADQLEALEKDDPSADNTVRGALRSVAVWLEAPAKDDRVDNDTVKAELRHVVHWLERGALADERLGADDTIKDALELLIGWLNAPASDQPAGSGSEKIKHRVISAEAMVCARSTNVDAVHERLCDLLAGKPPADFNFALARKILEARNVPGFLINWWFYQLEGKDTVLNFLGRDKMNRFRILEEMGVALKMPKENFSDPDSSAALFAKTTSDIYSPDSLFALGWLDNDAGRMAIATLRHDMGLVFRDEALSMLVGNKEAENKTHYAKMGYPNMEPLDSKREALCTKMTSRYERMKRWRKEPPGAGKLVDVCMRDPAMVRSYLIAVEMMRDEEANGLVDSTTSRGISGDREMLVKAFDDACQTYWTRQLKKRESEKEGLEQRVKDAVDKQPVEVNEQSVEIAK